MPSLAACAALLLLTAPDGTARLFDMGTDRSELRPGFTRVTPKSVYSKAAGFGWESSAGLKPQYQYYERQWKDNASSGRAEPPPIYTNEATCDAVVGDRPNTLTVDLPDGDYAVTAYCGVSSGARTDLHWFELDAGGAAAEVKIPGPMRFETVALTGRARGGQLKLSFTPRTTWAVAAVAIAPVAAAGDLRATVLAPLEKEIYFLPPDVAAQWKETQHVDPRPMPEFSASDKARGYAVFARHWSEVIYPNTVPRAEELNPQLSLFAAPGEYEPATFTVLPLADLGACRVEVGPLSDGARTIAAEQIEVRTVRYMIVRPNYSTFFSYHVAPDVLELAREQPIAKGVNARFWITVRVPADAAAGVYRGKLVFRPGRGATAEIPLRLRVVPIALEKNPGHIYGMYYYDPLHQVDPRNRPEANAFLERKAELERRDLRSHGINNHTHSARGLKREDDGRWTFAGDDLARQIELDRAHGMAAGPLVMSFPVGYYYEKLVDRGGLGSHMRGVRADVPDSFFEEVTRMVAAIEAERTRRGWPEFLYYPIDEPSTSPASVAFMVKVLAACRRVPGCRTYVTADPSVEAFGPLWPHVDVWCCQPFVFDHEKIRRLSAEKKIEFWCYPNHISGENDHTPVRGARMTFGYGFWKSGFRALIPWIYQASSGDPWNYLDGRSMDFMNRYTADGDPVPVALWEAMREGIDDGRYIYTLAQRVEAARKRGLAAAADRGQRTLDELWQAIVPQEKYKYDDLWSGGDFDARRWKLAAAIIALDEALAP